MLQAGDVAQFRVPAQHSEVLELIPQQHRKLGLVAHKPVILVNRVSAERSEAQDHNTLEASLDCTRPC